MPKHYKWLLIDKNAFYKYEKNLPSSLSKFKECWVKISADDSVKYFLFSPENRVRHSMQTVSLVRIVSLRRQFA